jgi:hypothetical protein
MKTLILTLLLLLPLSSIADTPCHVAITSYERQIDSLETRLATAQSLPYNQGYQEGYKVAKATTYTADEVGNLIGMITLCLLILSVPIAMIVISLKN